jgi:hypothetical protein
LPTVGGLHPTTCTSATIRLANFGRHLKVDFPMKIIGGAPSTAQSRQMPLNSVGHEHRVGFDQKGIHIQLAF